MTKIIVGVDRTERSRDAVALAAELARTAGTEVILANTYSYDGVPSHAAGPEFDRRLRAEATETLQRAASGLAGIVPELRALPGSTAARELHALAEHECAALVVIGSSHRGDVGRVFAGTTAERLLHGSPCPVAVAPNGFAEREGREVKRIVVAHDGGREAKAALEAAMSAARSLSAAVRVVRVLGPSRVSGVGAEAWPAYPIPADQIELEAREQFEADIAALPEGDAVEAVFVVGDPVEELASQSEAADLVVTGSRGYGPLRAVLLGGVSGRLVRAAACPVIVIPRGVGSHFEQLFADAGSVVS